MNEGTQDQRDQTTASKTQGETGFRGDKLDLLGFEERFKELEKKAGDVSADFKKIEKDFDNLEKRLDRNSSFMMWVTAGIALIFFGTFILIALDYFKYAPDRFNSIGEQVQKNQEGINDLQAEINNLKQCLVVGGWNTCFIP